MKLSEYKWLAGQVSELPEDLRVALQDMGIVTLEDFAIFLSIKETTDVLIGFLNETTKGTYHKDNLAQYAAKVDIAVLKELMKIPEDIRDGLDRGEIFPHGYLIDHESVQKVDEDKAIHLQTRISFPDISKQDIDLPPFVDLRKGLPPIKDQGGRGTCVSFATTALREYFESNNTDFSENYLYWGCKQIDGIKELPGTYIRCSFEWITGEVPSEHSNVSGICLEKHWPYEKERRGNETNGDPTGAAKKDAPEHRAKSFRQFSSSDIMGVKSVLAGKNGMAKGRPITFGVPVFNSWYRNPVTIQTGRIPMPLPNEGWIGGHAMLITGYIDDSRFPGGGVFIFRNSWSERWGSETIELKCKKGKTVEVPAGYGIVPYAFIERHGRELSTLEVDKWKGWHKSILKGRKYIITFFLLMCLLASLFILFKESTLLEKTPDIKNAVEETIFKIQKPIENFFLPSSPMPPDERKKYRHPYRKFNYKFLAQRYIKYIQSEAKSPIPLEMVEYNYRWVVFIHYSDEDELEKHIESIEKITHYVVKRKKSGKI
ncbi:C1 family peptidase [Thermodesulfobacteriota bacterium]